MPGVRNGTRGGKREKRRKAIYVANLEAGRWTEVRPSTSSRFYTFTYDEQSSSSSAAPSSAVPSAAPSSAPPTPVDTQVETSALTGIPIAIDFHRVLDGGSVDGFIPAENVRAVAALIAAGFIPWILSYIGTAGPDSSRRRQALEHSRRKLARQLGLSEDLPSEPVSSKIFAYVCDRKLFNNRLQCGGKAEQLEHFDTQILLDDNKHICAEAAEWGQHAYIVPDLDFPRVVEEVLYDARRGLFSQL